MSLGGSPEPLIKSIKTHTPDHIIFLASHDSVALSGEILKSLDYKPTAEYEITEDPNLIFECYKTARCCLERVKKTGVNSKDVLVDYTGGTKVMTAALVMATAGFHFKFNYVGGKKRNKNGVGVVTDRHEKMFAEMNPWSVFAEEERRQVITLFNQRRFAAVCEIISTFDRDLPIEIRDYFRFVQPLAEGFLNWDQFNHKAALRKINDGSLALEDYLSSRSDSSLKEFSKQVNICRKFLDQVIDQTEGSNKYHRIIICDLLNNARRKIEDKRYDDAAARIYRSLELYGQIAFQNVAGCSNDSVRKEVIPEAIRDEFIRKYRDPGRDVLKLPQSATFEFLKAKGHEAGVRFFEKRKEIKKIQANRNGSILAHGLKPVSEKAINSIFNTVTEFVQETCFFDFPELP